CTGNPRRREPPLTSRTVDAPCPLKEGTPAMPRPPRSRWMWFSAGATAAVVVATAVLLWQRPTGPAEHTTAEPPTEELAVPSSVDAVEWTWEAPDGVAVRRVDRAAAGAVAVLDDGVVAVHGRTGA